MKVNVLEFCLRENIPIHIVDGTEVSLGINIDGLSKKKFDRLWDHLEHPDKLLGFDELKTYIDGVDTEDKVRNIMYAIVFAIEMQGKKEELVEMLRKATGVIEMYGQIDDAL